MVAATTAYYQPPRPADDARWLPVDDAVRSSSSSGAPGGVCRLPPDVAIATGRAVRFADFSPGTAPAPPSVRPGAPPGRERGRGGSGGATESLADGLGRGLCRAVASCVGSDDVTVASAADEGRDDDGPPPTGPFRFDLEGLEGLLNCVPLEYDPRSPRSREAQDRRDGGLRDGLLRDEAEWRLRAERDAVLSGAEGPFGPGGDGPEGGGAGSLLQLAGGGGSPRSILRGGGGVVAIPPPQQQRPPADSTAALDVPGGLFGLPSGEEDSGGTSRSGSSDATPDLAEGALDAGSGAPDEAAAHRDDETRRPLRPPAGFRDLSSRSGDGGEGSAAPGRFAGGARDDVLRAARLAVHNAIGSPLGGGGGNNDGSWGDDVVECARGSGDGATERGDGRGRDAAAPPEPPETPSRSRSREEGSDGDPADVNRSDRPPPREDDEDIGIGLASLNDLIMRRGAEALGADAVRQAGPEPVGDGGPVRRGHGDPLEGTPQGGSEESRALNEHYDRLMDSFMLGGRSPGGRPTGGVRGGSVGGDSKPSTSPSVYSDARSLRRQKRMSGRRQRKNNRHYGQTGALYGRAGDCGAAPPNPPSSAGEERTEGRGHGGDGADRYSPPGAGGGDDDSVLRMRDGPSGESNGDDDVERLRGGEDLAGMAAELAHRTRETIVSAGGDDPGGPTPDKEVEGGGRKRRARARGLRHLNALRLTAPSAAPASRTEEEEEEEEPSQEAHTEDDDEELSPRYDELSPSHIASPMWYDGIDGGGNAGPGVNAAVAAAVARGKADEWERKVAERVGEAGDLPDDELLDGLAPGRSPRRDGGGEP